jgi:hypothetical protein
MDDRGEGDAIAINIRLAVVRMCARRVFGIFDGTVWVQHENGLFMFCDILRKETYKR